MPPGPAGADHDFFAAGLAVGQEDAGDAQEATAPPMRRAIPTGDPRPLCTDTVATPATARMMPASEARPSGSPSIGQARRATITGLVLTSRADAPAVARSTPRNPSP